MVRCGCRRSSHPGGSPMMGRFPDVLPDQVGAEVAREVAPHRVDVIRVVLRVVVLDQKGRPLHPVVVARTALGRAGLGEGRFVEARGANARPPRLRDGVGHLPGVHLDRRSRDRGGSLRDTRCCVQFIRQDRHGLVPDRTAVHRRSKGSGQDGLSVRNAGAIRCRRKRRLMAVRTDLRIRGAYATM